jgi:ABC-2 type transport system permease protein
MSHALHAEWTKQRTIATTYWLLLGAITMTVALSTIVTLAVTYHSTGSGQDLTKLSLTGVYLGQAIVAILAVLTIANEYGTGMIQTTLAAIPQRPTVLTAKAVILTTLILTAGTAAVLTSLLTGRLTLPANGFTTAHGYQLLSLLHGATLRAAVGSVLYLALIGLLSLGIATMVRDAATAIGIVLGLLYLFPIIAHLVPGPQLERLLEQIGPMTAGLTIQTTTHIHSQVIGPWAGLGVLAAWATAALLAGALFLRLRDA